MKLRRWVYIAGGAGIGFSLWCLSWLIMMPVEAQRGDGSAQEAP